MPETNNPETFQVVSSGSPNPPNTGVKLYRFNDGTNNEMRTIDAAGNVTTLGNF